MSGLILIDRSILKHHIVGIKNPLRFSAWCWMLAKARYKPGTYFDAGHEIPLEVGQFVCGRKFMSDETGMTEKQVRTFLTALERSDMVTKTVHEKGQGVTIVTICNYTKYQSFEEYRASKGPSTGPAKGQGRAKVGPHSVTTEETTDVTTYNKNEAKASQANMDLGESKPKRKVITKHSFPEWIKPDHAQGILDQRRGKKAPVTEFWFKQFIAKMEQVRERKGDPNAAIALIIDKNWQGFEVDWFFNSNNRSQGGQQSKPGGGSFRDQLRREGVIQ